MDRPKLLEDPEARATRLKELQRSHIAPLTRFVEDLRAEAGPGAAIPYFDPWDGGVEAELLFLLEAPGARAVNSGFVSRNNPDETAKNFFELNIAAGIPRAKTIIWNAVPWYIGNGNRIRAATADDLQLGLQPLPRLLQLLRQLRTVVLVGRKAEKASLGIRRERPTLRLFLCPHPSPLFVNHAPGNRDRILQVLHEAGKTLSVGATVA